MDVSKIGVEGQEKNGLEALCRLCGVQDSNRMLHLSDTYSIGVAVTSSIFHLLDSIAALLKVQEECEESMPKHVCVACFNTAVDIQAFVDSAVSFQKSTICQLFPNAKLEEVPELPFAAPSQGYLQDSSDLIHCDSVEQSKEEPIGSVSSSHTAFDDGNFQYDKTNSQEHHTGRPLALKNVGYNIISKVIDTGCDESNETHSSETVIEISSSCPTTDQPCILQALKNNIDKEESEENIDENVSMETSRAYDESDKVSNNGVELRSENEAAELQPSTLEESTSPKVDSKKCPTCGKTFSRLSQLKSHLTSHSESRPFECNICFMKFKYRRNLVEHSSIHDDPPSFICSICGLTFKQRSNLLKHERTHQKINRLSFQCSICNKRYSQSSHLRTHMRNIHGDNHGYTCDQCSAILQSRSSLRRHTATVHASSSKFACPHCNKGFNNTQNYQGHIRSHTGERPYCCSTCNKTFTTSKALSRHRLIHQGTKSHRCSQCGKAFLELCDLKRHVKRHLLKRVKSASKELAGKYQEGASVSVQSMVPGMNSLNLMVLPDSLLFTESQQLLDNSGSSAEIILPDEKLNTVKSASAEPVLETSLMQNSEYNIEPASGSIPKESHILRTEGEVLSSALLPSPQGTSAQDVETVPILDDTDVLRPPEVMSDMTATPLHSSSVLQSDNINVQDAITPADANCETSGPSECPADSEAATMVVLSSVGTTSDYLPVADHNTVIEGTRNQQGERVLSHATW